MSGMAAAQVLTQARRLADEVLCPSAMNVDNADKVPTEHLKPWPPQACTGWSARLALAGSIWTWPRFAM
jgi:hypothetical protein